MFLGLPDPDPSINKQKSKKNLDFYYFLLLFFDFSSLKNDVNVSSKSNRLKNFEKRTGAGSRAAAGSVSQWYKSGSKCHGSTTLNPRYQELLYHAIQHRSCRQGRASDQ
jgi:hypothetical protein